MSKFTATTSLSQLMRVFPGFANFLNPGGEQEINDLLSRLLGADAGLDEFCRLSGRDTEQTIVIVNEAFENWLRSETSVRELSALQTHESSELLLIDIREPWEMETAQIPGSLRFQETDQTELLQTASRYKHVIVYCHHGIRSLYATTYFRENGVPQALSLRGGIDAYSVEVDQSIPRY